MAGGRRTQRRRRPWWTTWWGLTVLFVVSCALIYQPAMLLLAFAGVAWSGCIDCGPTNRPLAFVQYTIVAIMVATPILTLIFAARAWIGWLTGVLCFALASWVWFLFAVGTL